MATLLKRVKLSELQSMSPASRTACINELFQAALHPSPDAVQERLNELNVKIRDFESKYALSSDKLEEKVKTGQAAETDDVCSWLMLLRKKRRFEQYQSKTSAY